MKSSVFLMLLCSLAFTACSSDDTALPEEPAVPEENSPDTSVAVEVVTMSADNILSGNAHSRTAFTLEAAN